MLPSMRERNSRTILNNSSIYGRIPNVCQGSYGVSKYVLEKLSDRFRVELPEYDVDVVLVELGPVETRSGKTALGTNGDFERSDGYDWVEETSNERTV